MPACNAPPPPPRQQTARKRQDSTALTYAHAGIACTMSGRPGALHAATRRLCLWAKAQTNAMQHHGTKHHETISGPRTRQAEHATSHGRAKAGQGSRPCALGARVHADVVDRERLREGRVGAGRDARQPPADGQVHLRAPHAGDWSDRALPCPKFCARGPTSVGVCWKEAGSGGRQARLPSARVRVQAGRPDMCDCP